MADESHSGERPLWPYIVGALVLGLLVVGFFFIRDLIAFGRPAPEFPSLADQPDPALHGTVAYFAMVGDPKTQIDSGCVRVIAASGAESKDVLCLSDAGSDTGPQLAFLPDGRLEVTMFSWPVDQPLVVAWQKIVDVRTGAVEEVPAGQPPAAPSAQGATVTPAGEQIIARTGGNEAELALVSADGAARTLWSAEVSPEYSIRAIWAPNWEWVLAYDGRLLVATVDDPAVIRVLVAEPAGLGGWGSTEPRMATYAVTEVDLVGTG
ncbi:MAG: hypothetical protein JW785_01415 [Acidimicrobiia bacterium]|nr:hypothetical protein [Acidimicrobiia bacterium]